MNFIRNFPLGFTGLWILQIIFGLGIRRKSAKESFADHSRISGLLPFKWGDAVSYINVL